jgi:uncharacterized protein (DUF58 family)
VRADLQVPGPTRYQLVVELELEGGQRARTQADVVAGTTGIVLRLPPLPRGVHQLRHACVRSSYPLGLFEARRRFEVPRELVVYPTPAPLAAARSASEALADALGSGGRGRGDVQPASLRDHRREDGPRAVHWRASARRGALVVREWEGGAEQGLELLLDRRCEPALLEESLSLISALVEIARANKELLRLTSQGLDASFGPGRRPWIEALRFLAAAEPLAPDGPAPPPASPAVTRLPLAMRHVR